METAVEPLLRDNVLDAASRLNGSEYGSEGTPAFFAAMKATGLVAVFGASDDLMEFRGAIYGETGAWNGTTAYVTPAGLLGNECHDEDCPYHARLKKRAMPIRAIWDDGDFSWRYETAIPHATFVVNEDGEPYCQGIVFALADVPAARPDAGGA